MKYLTLAVVVLGLYACSPNPLFHTPGAVCANGVPADSWQCSNAQTPVTPMPARDIRPCMELPK